MPGFGQGVGGMAVRGVGERGRGRGGEGASGCRCMASSDPGNRSAQRFFLNAPLSTPCHLLLMNRRVLHLDGS